MISQTKLPMFVSPGGFPGSKRCPENLLPCPGNSFCIRVTRKNSNSYKNNGSSHTLYRFRDSLPHRIVKYNKLASANPCHYYPAFVDAAKREIPLFSNHSARKRKQNNLLLSASEKTSRVGGGISFTDQT